MLKRLNKRIYRKTDSFKMLSGGLITVLKIDVDDFKWYVETHFVLLTLKHLYTPFVENVLICYTGTRNISQKIIFSAHSF